MDPSCTDREVKAVDSEFSKNLPDDDWRTTHLQCSLSRPGHTLGRFSSGRLLMKSIN
jgi:insulysin